MSQELTDRLERCYTGIIHDTMRAMGLKDFVLPAELRPLLPGQKLAGPAFTVEGKTGEFDAHETLLGWTGLLSAAKPGHVWVCQPNTNEIALMGELSAETLKFRGVRGVVADGGTRDAEFIIDMGLQVWHRYFTPRDIVSHWLPDAFDVPVTIGSVRIEPGDYVFGDTDGMVRLPRDQAEAIVTASEEAMGKENLVRTAILQGVDPQEAYLRHGKF